MSKYLGLVLFLAAIAGLTPVAVGANSPVGVAQQQKPTPTPTPTPMPCLGNPSGEALPTGDLVGWHQVLSDDFSTTALDSSKWGAYSGEPGDARGTGWWSPSHLVVGNCLATFRGYLDPAVKRGRYVTAGMGSYLNQTYGKYLIRMRVDKGNGIGQDAILMPSNGNWPPEIDFYEDGGGNRMSSSATLHDGPNGNDCCKTQRTTTAYDFSQWHTVGVEWTAGKLAYTVDGLPWAVITNLDTTGSGVPSIAMWLALQQSSLNCSPWNTCVDGTTPAEVDTQIDWVSIYAPIP